MRKTRANGPVVSMSPPVGGLCSTRESLVGKRDDQVDDVGGVLRFADDVSDHVHVFGQDCEDQAAGAGPVAKVGCERRRVRRQSSVLLSCRSHPYAGRPGVEFAAHNAARSFRRRQAEDVVAAARERWA